MKLTLLLAAMCVASVHSARILAIFPFLSKSHTIVLKGLATELARRGHEMVVVSAYPLDKKLDNYTDVNLMPDLAKGGGVEVITHHSFDRSQMTMYQKAKIIWMKGLGVTQMVANTPTFQRLLKDEKGFDLVIVEVFLNEGVYALARHFKAPLVLLCSFGGFHFHNYAFANPIPLSYYPNPILDFSDKMDFTERLTNFLTTTLWDLGHFFYYLPGQDALSKKIFGSDTPHVSELESQAAVVLMNSHFSLNYPRPLLPNIVEVGGLHVSREVKPLAKEFKDFLDDAKQGAIYFSMGSNLKSELMGEERIKAFVEAFAELPQKVLWKWESDSLPGQPKNLMVAPWMPQQEILAHPNVQVFITHGGLLSAQESAYHGVTLVGIPIFGDQMLNMKKAQQGGFGIYLDFNNITKVSVKWALNEALNNPQIKEASRQRSAQYRDQPESPLDRAVFWVEYALRHKGAKHLRSAGADLNWLQLGLWDVYAAILTPIFILIFIFKRFCCAGKNISKTSTKKVQ